MAKEEKESKSKTKNKTLSVELLDSYRGALYRLKEYFDSLEKFDMEEDIDKTMKVMDSLLKCGEKLGRGIETLEILEKKVATETQVNSKIRGNAKLSLLEDETI